MSVRLFSEMTYYSALSWKELGQRAKAARLLRGLLAYAGKLEVSRQHRLFCDFPPDHAVVR